MKSYQGNHKYQEKQKKIKKNNKNKEEKSIF